MRRADPGISLVRFFVPVTKAKRILHLDHESARRIVQPGIRWVTTALDAAMRSQRWEAERSMSARNHDSSGELDRYRWDSVVQAEAAIAALPDGDYAVTHLYAISPRAASAALYILSGHWAHPPERGVTFTGESGKVSLQRPAKAEPVRKDPANWVFRVRNGELTELVKKPG
jgi:hypothetical protein